MKKLLLGSIAMFLLALSITLFQISCTKEAHAQTNPGNNYVLPPASATTLGGVIVGNGLNITSNGTLSVNTNSSETTPIGKIIFKKGISANENYSVEIWTANYDGTNASKVNIQLPSDISISQNTNVTVSPDGKKIFFTAGEGSSNNVTAGDLYSCNSDGTNVTKIIDKGGNDNDVTIGSAY